MTPFGENRGGTPIGERAPSKNSRASGRTKRQGRVPHPQRCGGCNTAPVGVPLPSFFPVSEAEERRGEVRGFWWLLLKRLGCEGIARTRHCERKRSNPALNAG